MQLLSYVGGVSQWLATAGILLKEFLPFTVQLTKRLHPATEQFADESRRPIQYLESKVDKEALVREIRDRQSPADNGLVAMHKTLEACTSFDIFRNRETHSTSSSVGDSANACTTTSTSR